MLPGRCPGIRSATRTHTQHIRAAIQPRRFCWPVIASQIAQPPDQRRASGFGTSDARPTVWMTVWPSGLRCWPQAPVRTGRGSPPTAVRRRDELFFIPSAIKSHQLAVRSSGMIRALGARGPGFNSRNGPCCSACMLSQCSLTSIAGRNLPRPVSPHVALSPAT